MLICPDETDSSGLAAKGQAARQIEFWMRDANHDNVKLWLVPQKSSLELALGDCER